MIPAFEKARLQKVFISTLHWVEQRRITPNDAKDVAFLISLEKYVRISIGKTAVVKTKSELARLQQRAEKVQVAAILFVQRRLK